MRCERYRVQLTPDRWAQCRLPAVGRVPVLAGIAVCAECADELEMEDYRWKVVPL